MLVLGGCTVGAPPGFASGDRWSIPLIGPIEDGLLLVPAFVNGKGPFVFAIDPDAHVSIVDQDVVREAQTRTGEGPHLLDETDTQQPRFYAEILQWELGSLTVEQKPAQIVPPHTFDADGRRIHGVIGRDIIADSLVFTFDRDNGIIVLATQKAAPFPKDMTSFRYSLLDSRIQNAEVLPISRRLVDVTIGGQKFAMHVDFGQKPSQLRPRSWAKAGLAESDVKIALVDEVGMSRDVKKQGVAESVTVGPVTAHDVSFVPYVDKRWDEDTLEGALGLDVFDPYTVMVNWDSRTIGLRPRGNPTANVVARIGRWQSKTLSSCQNVGCVKPTLIDPLQGKEPTPPAVHPGVVATFAREPAAKVLDLEILIAATPAPGKPPLKWLIVNMPPGVERTMTHLSADYIGATLTVLDASQFPRSCPGDGGCVDLLTPPMSQALPPSMPAPPPAAAQPEPPAPQPPAPQPSAP